MSPTSGSSFSKAASKTKILAMRNKPRAKVSLSGKDGKGGGTPDEKLLARMMERYAEFEGDADKAATSFCNIMKDFGMNDRNTGYRQKWTMLSDNGLVEPMASGAPTFTSDYRLTEVGIGEAAANGFELEVPSKPQTNEDLHEMIKNKCMNKRGEQIFDLLLTKGPLTRKELAEGHLKISNRGAYFSYALQQLKELGYVEKDPDGGGKKLRLSDKCFLDPASDREAFLVKATVDEEEEKEEENEDVVMVKKTGEDEEEETEEV